MVRAAVLTEVGGALRVTDLELPDPGPSQVRVRIAATGVCHSDLSLARGTLAQPVPAVLGHEAAGTITAIGASVDTVSVGDRVVLCWAPPCGDCWFCTADEPWLCEHAADAASEPYAKAFGTDVYPGLSTGGFAEETVVSARAVIGVPDAVPLEHAALVGCAVMTGVGAVLNTARVRPGQSVLVVGLGRLGDRVGHRRLMIFLALGAGLFYIPQAFVTGIVQLIVLRGLLGFFDGGLLPSANALISAGTEGEGRGSHGTTYGLIYLATGLGFGLGPLSGGFIAASLGLRSVFLITAFILLALAVYLPFGVKEPRARTATVPAPSVS